MAKMLKYISCPICSIWYSYLNLYFGKFDCLACKNTRKIKVEFTFKKKSKE